MLLSGQNALDLNSKCVKFPLVLNSRTAPARSPIGHGSLELAGQVYTLGQIAEYWTGEASRPEKGGRERVGETSSERMFMQLEVQIRSGNAARPEAVSEGKGVKEEGRVHCA